LPYLGHIRHLENYYAAGCFVQYLVERYGMDTFAALYPTSNYTALFAQPLHLMELEWRTHLAARPYDLPFPPHDLVEGIVSLQAEYASLFAGFSGTDEQMRRYFELDQRRLELLAGRP
jgi:hypothetical protein